MPGCGTIKPQGIRVLARPVPLAGDAGGRAASLCLRATAM